MKAKTLRRYRDGALVEVPLRFRVYGNTPFDVERAVASLLRDGVHLDRSVAGNDGKGRGYSYGIKSVSPRRSR